MVLQIDQLFRQLVQVPVVVRVLVDRHPCRLDRVGFLPAFLAIAVQHIVGNIEAALGEQPHGLFVEAGLGQLRTQFRSHFGHRLVHGHHVRFSPAEDEFHQAVLRGLEAAGGAQMRADQRIVVRGHRAQHVPALDQLLLRARHAGEHLERGAQAVLPNRLARGLQLVQAQLEPQLARLMDDDEHELVLRIGARMLRGENPVEIEIGGVSDAVIVGRVWHSPALAACTRGAKPAQRSTTVTCG